MNNICPKCKEATERRGYCLKCHAEKMRGWRKTHPLNEEQKRKDRARSYANVYVRRGKIERKTQCEVCGGAPVQMHHPDYSQPKVVVWLCKACLKDAVKERMVI